MHRVQAVAVAGLAVVAACTPDTDAEQPRLSVTADPTLADAAVRPVAQYAPPRAQPTPHTVAVNADRTQVWSAIIDALNGLEYQISFLDLQAGVLVYTFSGTGAGLVDCGVITTGTGAGRGVGVDAAAPRLTYARDLGDTPAIIDRDISLDTRSVVRVAAAGAGRASVDVDTVYVVTRDLRARAVGGPVVGARQDFAVFPSGGEGALQTTLCRPTGAVEQVVLANLDATELTDPPSVEAHPIERRLPQSEQRPPEQRATEQQPDDQRPVGPPTSLSRRYLR